MCRPLSVVTLPAHAIACWVGLAGELRRHHRARPGCRKYHSRAEHPPIVWAYSVAILLSFCPFVARAPLLYLLGAGGCGAPCMYCTSCSRARVFEPFYREIRMSIVDLPPINPYVLAPQMLQIAMDHLPQTVFWKDRNLVYLGCNQRFANDALLTTPAAIIGKTDYDMPWTAQAALYRADDQQVIDSGIAKLNFEEPQSRPDGTTNWLRTSKIPLLDAAGEIVGVLGMYEDITEYKRIEVERADLQEQIIRTQQNALAELSTPLLKISDTTMVMPLVGTVDSRRVSQIMDTLLNGVATNHVSTVIMDITGVAIVDTQVADAFIRASQAVSLLGAQVVLTGIRPEVAQTLVQLGVDLRTIITRSTLRDGINYALNA
jgi:rsbT co-antagonist protein RsbR